MAAIAVFVGFELAYAIWVAFIGHSWVGPRVGYGPDSALYIASAREPLWSRNFFAGPGAFGFLLLAKLCARNFRAIVMVQTVLAMGAWTLLATTVVGVVRSGVARWVALIAILSVGVSPAVLQWNAFITTESLSISALCVVLALGLRLVDRGTRRDVYWFVVGMAVFAYTRDTNALVIGALAIVVLVLALVLRRTLRVRCAVIGIAGIVLPSSASALANAADPPRWYWPVAETTAIRLLADPGATKYLVHHGFPFDEQMRSLPTLYIYLYDPVRKGASFAAFRHWVRVDGRSVYFEYLLSHPGWALRKPFDDRDAFFNLGVVEIYSKTYHNRPGGPFTVVGMVATPSNPLVAELWTLLAALGLVVLPWQRSIRRSLLGVAALSGGLAIVGYYTAWYGDALEVYRHALSAAVELRLVLWIVTIVVIDTLAERRSSARHESGNNGRRPGADCGAKAAHIEAR